MTSKDYEGIPVEMADLLKQYKIVTLISDNAIKHAQSITPLPAKIAATRGQHKKSTAQSFDRWHAAFKQPSVQNPTYVSGHTPLFASSSHNVVGARHNVVLKASTLPSRVDFHGVQPPTSRPLKHSLSAPKKPQRTRSSENLITIRQALELVVLRGEHDDCIPTIPKRCSNSWTISAP